MNLIKTIMYALCAGYESNKLDYVIHILIMGIMAIIDDNGMIMGSCFVSVFPYIFSWLRILLNILCMRYVLPFPRSRFPASVEFINKASVSAGYENEQT